MNFGPVDSLELIIRFIFSERHFNRSKMKVLHGAFYPPKNKRLSVFLRAGLPNDKVWEEGKVIGIKRGISLKARADIQAKCVIETGLSIDAGEGRTRHADIVGWEDSLILEKATELALRATLNLLA